MSRPSGNGFLWYPNQGTTSSNTDANIRIATKTSLRPTFSTMTRTARGEGGRGGDRCDARAEEEGSGVRHADAPEKSAENCPEASIETSVETSPETSPETSTDRRRRRGRSD